MYDWEEKGIEVRFAITAPLDSHSIATKTQTKTKATLLPICAKNILIAFRLELGFI